MASVRIRLYHKDCPAGRVFTEEEDYLAHLADGWVDFPSKIITPDPVTLPPVVTPKATVKVKPDNPWAVPKVGTKKPGRPSNKFKGGKK